MKLVLESTPQITHVGGVECRVWRGRTGEGVEVIAFVHRLAVDKADDAAEFDRELRAAELPPVVVPLWMVLG